MNGRIWLHQRLVNDPTLMALLQRDSQSYAEGRDAVFQGKSLNNSPGKWPFLVHIMGNNTHENLGQGALNNRQYCEIWVHDSAEQQTYDDVDGILERLRTLLCDPATDGTQGVITSHLIEMSRDLDDQEMGTICRYLRLQLVGAT